jgi:hypothetical protein
MQKFYDQVIQFRDKNENKVLALETLLNIDIVLIIMFSGKVCLETYG